MVYLVPDTIWIYAMIYPFTVYLTFYQQLSNGLLQHYRKITTLLDKELHQW